MSAAEEQSVDMTKLDAIANACLWFLAAMESEWNRGATVPLALRMNKAKRRSA